MCVISEIHTCSDILLSLFLSLIAVTQISGSRWLDYNALLNK